MRPYFSVRSRPIVASCFLLVAALTFQSAQAQRDFDDVEIRPTRLTDSVYMLEGAGGNLGALIGPDGVVLIDDQFAPLSDKIRAAIGKLDSRAVRFVINTHWHGDHTGGNESFGKTGTVIVAHDNVRQRMSTDQFLAAFDRTVPASPAAAWPVLTFAEGMTFHLNGETLQVFHLPRGHTDGDSAIYFQESDVLHTGDLFFNGRYPFIDVSSGGGIDGVIAAADTMLKRIGRSTKIIPGHGPLATQADLVAYREMLVGARKAVQALVQAGKDEDETVAAAPTAAWDEAWGQGGMPQDRFVRTVYQSLKPR